MAHHLEPNRIQCESIWIIQCRPQGRIRILSVALKPDKPSQVIDPRNPSRHFIRRSTYVTRQNLRRALHAVTQTDRRDFSNLANRPTSHRHRIRVVQQRRTRCNRINVLRNVNQYRNSPQSLEYAARTNRVTNRLINAILHRNAYVAFVHIPHANRRQDVISVPQRIPSISSNRYTAARSDLGKQLLRELTNHFKPRLVNVHQGDFRIP